MIKYKKIYFDESEYVMENYSVTQTKKDVSAKTSSKLMDMLRNMDFVNADAAKSKGVLSARARITRLFDEGTFVEIGTYVKNSSDDSFAGVICGYGAIDGRLVFVFSQDYKRENAFVDEFYTKKILTLYDMAIKNGAPIIGIFDTDPASSEDIKDISSLSGIGKIMSAANSASGIVPQIAIITGACDESFAIIASMFDFVICGCPDNYILNKNAALSFENEYTAIAGAIDLIKRLPLNNVDGTVYEENGTSINRMLDQADFSADYDLNLILNKISDNNDFVELYQNTSKEIAVGFSFIGGASIGICANRHQFDTGLISADAAKKAAKFVSFCDSFNIPLLTLVDSVGVEKSPESISSLSSLAFAYAASSNAKVSVILGNAVDVAYTLMGSKSLGTDIVFAIKGANSASLSDNVENDFVSDGEAARMGEIDDIIEYSELRKRICSAFEMLSSKSTLPFSKKSKSYAVRGW